jgi:ribosomal protein L12E/L44/L45/RPP1/RPP2
VLLAARCTKGADNLPRDESEEEEEEEDEEEEELDEDVSESDDCSSFFRFFAIEGLSLFYHT